MNKIYYSIISILILFMITITLIYNKYNKKEDVNKIVVAEVTHSVFYSPFYVALENNYFKDENLDVEVILTSGADKVASSVLSNDANIGLSGLEATLYVYNNKAEDYLVSFNALTKRDGQFLFGSCELKENFNINMLKNKTILAGRKGGMPSMVFNYALYKNNISEDEVIIDNSVDFASLTSAYIAKQGDFVNLFEPTALNLEKQNYGCVLANLGLLSGEVPYTVFHAKKSYINNNSNVIKRFTKAINKGLSFVKNNSSKEIASVIKKEFSDLDINDLEKAISRYKEADSWWDNTYIKEEAYNNLLDIMSYNKALDNKPPFKELVNNTFNE